MQIKWISVPALALCLASTGGMKAKASRTQPLPSAEQYQDRDWDQAPSEYRDAQRRGFHEGVEAARSDFQQRRHADADDHEIYKHPPVEENARQEFREGFREGYKRAMEHMKQDRDYERNVPRL